MKYVIAPSILSADFTQLGSDIRQTGRHFCILM